MHEAEILVVEDDCAMRSLIGEELRDNGYAVRTAADAERALEAQHAAPADLVISDLKLPGADGMALLQSMNRLHLRPAFVMVTAFGTVEQAMQAVKAGADDFLTKPLDIDQLLVVVRRVLEMHRLRHEVQRYRELVGGGDFHGMIGRCRPMRELFDQIGLVASADGPVLVLGESGTGKEEVARAIHAESDVSGGSFVAVNCAGIPPDLIESEFFGHEAGAFTGASKTRKGLFAEADGGTLLLDEIGEMPLAMQAKLLRVMENGSIRPVGGNREQQVRVRVIAATHRDLESLIRRGDFREDLYYRLESLTLAIPPLRRRGEDIDLLAARFLAQCCAAQTRQLDGFTEGATGCLHSYSWPGNVRELQNVIQRAVTFCRDSVIDQQHLPPRMRRSGGVPQAYPDSATDELLAELTDGPILPTLDELQHRYMHHVLQQTGGNKRRAAALLGIGRRTLYRWLGDDDDSAGAAPEHSPNRSGEPKTGTGPG